MNVVKSDKFTKWFDKLRDTEAKSTIEAKLFLISLDQRVDSKMVRPHVFELRIFKQPGYRVYYTIHKDCFVMLGGTKSTQDADIDKAEVEAKRIRSQDA